MGDYTPPQSPIREIENNAIVDAAVDTEHLRRSFKRKIKHQNKLIVDLKTKLNKYKKRLSRSKMIGIKQNAVNPSPNTRVLNTCTANATSSSPTIVRKLIFAEAIQDQLAKSYNESTTHVGKREIQKLLAGNILKKYKLLSF